MEITIKKSEYDKLKRIEAQYHELEMEIAQCYEEAEDDEPDLITIGEIAASHFDYL